MREVASLGFVEDLAHHRGGILDHTRCQPLVRGGRTIARSGPLGVANRQDVGRGARDGAGS